METCCKNIYNICAPIPACTDVLSIKTPVISGTVIVLFNDKFDKNYTVSVDTDLNGIAEIVLVSYDGIVEIDLPEALLNQYAGLFRVTILDEFFDSLQWTINSLQYDAIGIMIGSFTPLSAVRPITFEIDPYTMEGTQGSYNL